MTISFSGLASGLDTSQWVNALVSLKQEKVTTLQAQLQASLNKKATLNDTRSIFNSFRTALEKFTDKKFGGTFDLFSQTTATSSNEDIFTVIASAGAIKQNYDITVQQLATYTKATSTVCASAVADDDTKLSALGIKEGSFNIYVDGVKTSIEIGADTTVGELIKSFDDAGVDAVIESSGALRLSLKDGGQNLSIGSTTDSSNIVSLLGLSKQDDGTYLSANSLFKANVSSVLTAEDAGFSQVITAGTFKIGDAEFKIDENTTLSSLISQINESEEAQATAYWDNTTGKLTITSKKEGASYINIEAGTSNFTDVMGLTITTARDENGVPTESKMAMEAQSLGQNALFTINGTSMVSTSNTITSDVSRIAGVTITLNRVSTEEDGNTTLRVTQDTSSLVDAVKTFVSAYNDVINKVNEVTATGANLQRESGLTSVKNTLRNYAMGSNFSNGGVYKLLSDIGISPAKADGNNLSIGTETLTFDEEKFLKALEENPDSVEAILGGETGILAQMESAVEVSLKAVTGYFDVKQSTLDSDISKTKSKITKQQDKIAVYKTQLENKFHKMELLIAQMQQNYSSFLM